MVHFSFPKCPSSLTRLPQASRLVCVSPFLPFATLRLHMETHP
jgi:hypothetical protein